MSRYVIVEVNSNDKDNVRVIMVKGEKGYSAYDLYKQHGGTLTEAQWLDAFLNAENYYNKSEVNASQNAQNTIISKKPYYFNNIAEMKAYNLSAGDMAITMGYYQANDGGGGEYNIVSNSSLIDNGGSIHELSNGLKAKLIYNDILSPQQFGALGDGVFDDSIALEKCFNYCCENKIVVQLNGKYYIAQEITINSNKNLIIKGSTGQIGQTISGSNNAFSNFIFSSSGFIKITGTTNVTFQNICMSGSQKAIVIASFRNKIINCSFNGFNKAISTDTGSNWVGENQIMNCVFNTCAICIKLDHGSDEDISGNLADGTCTNFIISNNDAGCKIQNNHDYSSSGSEITGYNVTFVGNYIDGWDKLTIKGNSGFNITGNTFLGEAPESGSHYAIKFTNTSISSGLISSNTMCSNRNDLVNDYLSFVDITDVTYFSYVTISSNNLRIAKNVFKGASATKLELCNISEQCNMGINITNPKATLVKKISNFNNIFTGYAEINLDSLGYSQVAQWDRNCNIWLHIIKMDNESNYYTEISTSRNIVAKGNYAQATKMEVWSFGIKNLNQIPMLYSDN